MTDLKRIKGWDGSLFWRSADGGEFRRLIGGLAWACGELPGWLVVLGEERMNREDGRRHIRVLETWEAKDNGLLSPRELMAEAVAVNTRLLFDGWVSPGGAADAALLPMFNRERGRHDRRLVLRTPPGYDRKTAFMVYDRLLEHRTGREKTFHFGEAGRKLAAEYAVPRRADRLRPLEEFPAVAAALYALAWLELVPGDRMESTSDRWVVPTDAGY